MANCEFLEKCPIFQKCQAGLLDKIFIRYYCEGYKLELCARRILKKSGKEVPATLLPSGENIEKN